MLEPLLCTFNSLPTPRFITFIIRLQDHSVPSSCSVRFIENFQSSSIINCSLSSYHSSPPLKSSLLIREAPKCTQHDSSKPCPFIPLSSHQFVSFFHDDSQRKKTLSFTYLLPFLACCLHYFLRFWLRNNTFFCFSHPYLPQLFIANNEHCSLNIPSDSIHTNTKHPYTTGLQLDPIFSHSSSPSLPLVRHFPAPEIHSFRLQPHLSGKTIIRDPRQLRKYTVPYIYPLNIASTTNVLKKSASDRSRSAILMIKVYY